MRTKAPGAGFSLRLCRRYMTTDSTGLQFTMWHEFTKVLICRQVPSRLLPYSISTTPVQGLVECCVKPSAALRVKLQGPNPGSVHTHLSITAAWPYQPKLTLFPAVSSPSLHLTYTTVVYAPPASFLGLELHGIF